jgi:hypothetical protein
MVARISQRAKRLLQFAHSKEFQVLYAAARARVGNPITQPGYLRP